MIEVGFVRPHFQHTDCRALCRCLQHSTLRRFDCRRALTPSDLQRHALCLRVNKKLVETTILADRNLALHSPRYLAPSALGGYPVLAHEEYYVAFIIDGSDLNISEAPMRLNVGQQQQTAAEW